MIHYCPWCEGRKVTATLVFGEQPVIQTIMGMPVRVDGFLMDRACGVCGGTGYVSEGRHRELTRNPLDGPAEQWRDV